MARANVEAVRSGAAKAVAQGGRRYTKWGGGVRGRVAESREEEDEVEEARNGGGWCEGGGGHVVC